MSDFLLKQHLRLSPNAQVKNLVVETLEDDPLEADWKLGRLWYNITDGKFKCIRYAEENDGSPKDYLEIGEFGSTKLGSTLDGEYYPDGLYPFQEQTRISDAVDEMNEALKDLAPAEATPLSGILDLTENNMVTGYISAIDDDSNVTLQYINAGDKINNITKNTQLHFMLPTVGYMDKNEIQQQFAKADQGIINLSIDDDITDILSLIDLWNEESRDILGSEQGYLPEVVQTFTSSNGETYEFEANPNKDKYWSTQKYIKINKIERYNSFKKWQKGTGEIFIGYDEYSQSALSSGDHKIFVNHTNVDTGPFKTSDSIIFVDTSLEENLIPTVDSLFLILNDFDGLGYTSGIPFFNNIIEFSLSFEVSNLFKYTYDDNTTSISISRTDVDTNLKWNEQSNLSNKSVPSHSDILKVDNMKINYNGDYLENNIRGSFTFKKPTHSNTNIIKNINLPINTYGSKSTLIKEFFQDENQRLNKTTFDNIDDLNDIWDNTKLLSNGAAQVFQNKLSFPKDANTFFDLNEFSQTVKDKLTIPDYTNLLNQDNVSYFRKFKCNEPNSNGILKFKINNITDLKNDLSLNIKLPGISGWLDLLTMFDVEYYNNNYENDGTGCQTYISILNNIITINWTIGQLSTYDTDNSYVLKVELYNDSIEIESIEECGNGWS